MDVANTSADLDSTPPASQLRGIDCVTPQRSNDSSEVDQGEEEEEDGQEFCNPEPRKELLEGHPGLLNADKIGDTVFSKHWVFSTLMKLIQTVDAGAEKKDATESDQGLDLEDSLQDELCKLWDMSMNGEVVKFLYEFQALEILTGVIAKSRAPRATEVCVGILGNMACNGAVCQEISSNDKLVDFILLLLEEPDAPTLVETTRLLHVILSNPAVSGQWVEKIKQDSKLHNAVIFILQSSTNKTLLENTGELVDKLLDLDDSVCESWSTTEFAHSLLEAAGQIGALPSLDTYLHIFQLLSTSEKGVQALVSKEEALGDLLLKYLMDICSEEVVTVEGREGSLASAFSVLTILISSESFTKCHVFEEYKIMRCVLKVLEVVYPKVHKDSLRGKRETAENKRRRRRTRSNSKGSPLRRASCHSLASLKHCNSDQHKSEESTSSCLEQSAGDAKYQNGSPDGSSEMDAYEEKVTSLLYGILKGLLCDVVASVAKECEAAPVTLNYMDEMCTRERLYMCIWTLQEVNSSDCDAVQQLLTLSEQFSFERLPRIIEDALET